jgi:hypothetical protein
VSEVTLWVDPLDSLRPNSPSLLRWVFEIDIRKEKSQDFVRGC